MFDYFKVVTFRHFNDIITMYPYLNKERSSYTDIIPSITEVDGSRLKRMIQIDKFDQK